MIFIFNWENETHELVETPPAKAKHCWNYRNIQFTHNLICYREECLTSQTNLWYTKAHKSLFFSLPSSYSIELTLIADTTCHTRRLSL